MKNIIFTAISIWSGLLLIACSSTTQSQTVQNTPASIPADQKISPQLQAVPKKSRFEVSKQSCVDGVASGCIEFGYIMIDQKDYEMAKTAFSEAFRLGDKDGGQRGKYVVECLQNNAGSCDMLGYVFEEGLGGSRDYQAARAAYAKSIALGSPSSLSSLAWLYAKGLGGEKDEVQATKLYEAACNNPAVDRSVRMGACCNTALGYQKGSGVRQDFYKAKELYQKACDGGYATACTNLGFMYDYGKGVRQDIHKAKTLYGKGCDMGNQLGCKNYAILNSNGY